MAWERIDVTDDEIAAAARRWKKRARFLVDESIGPEAAAFLREQGWNATAVQDVGLTGRSDEDVYALAAREDRIVLSHDRGFFDDRRFPPHPRAGVVVLPGAAGDTEVLVRAVINMLAILGPYRDAYRGSKFVFNDDGTLVIRSRDASSGAMRNTRYRLRKNAMPERWVEDPMPLSNKRLQPTARAQRKRRG